MTLIRTLITGGATPELEAILAEGVDITSGSNNWQVHENRKRPRIAQISLYDGEFADFGVKAICSKTISVIALDEIFCVLKVGRTYGELFAYCLLTHNMLCLGIYRFRDVEEDRIKKTTPSSKRYVICNPDDDFCLLQTDLIYVLQQFDPTNKAILKNLPKTPTNLRLANKPNEDLTSSTSLSCIDRQKYYDCKSSDILTSNSRFSLKPSVTFSSMKSVSETEENNEI